MDRFKNFCVLFTLAGLLAASCGCPQRSKPVAESESNPVQADSIADGPATDAPKRYPEQDATATLLKPNLTTISNTPVAELANEEAKTATIHNVSQAKKLKVFRLPATEKDATDHTEDTSKLTIQVSDPIKNLVRLPDVSREARQKSEAVQVEEVVKEVEETTVVESHAEELGDAGSRWTVQQGASIWSEATAVTPSADATIVSPQVDVVTRLPEVVEVPTPAEPLEIVEPSLPEVPEFPSETELVVEENDPASERDVTEPTTQPVYRPDPMRAVNQQTLRAIRKSFNLAQRGATYSARIELIDSMRTIAEALDLRDGNRHHTDALKRGFRALDEAKDFRQHGLAEELDMEVLVAAHRTPVLKESNLAAVTPLVALQQYLTYASEQLAIAGGQQPTASLALYGLGRLQSDMCTAEDDTLPHAIVFHQAAVEVDCMNYKSANELGVLLAKYGQYAQSRDMLSHSVRVCPRPESWANLAKVHQRLGETDLARRANHESQLAARSGAHRHDDVQWVDSATLAGTIETQQPIRHIRRSSEVETQEPERNVSQSESEGIMRLIPWMRRGE